MARHPPRIVRSIWQRWLLASTGRLLRKEGVNQLVCYDIGARWGVWPRFAKLPLPIFSVGFEADKEEAEQLKKSRLFNQVVPTALSGKGGIKTLYIGHEPGCSSIYGPDLDLIPQHCCSPQLFRVVRTVQLDTVPLKQAINDFHLPPPDFIKLDVEGAELEILEGAENVLDDCAGVFFEARLAPFYRGEALFGPVASALLKRGFSITSFEPVGAFEGAIMLVDVGACRNLYLEKRRVQLLKSAAFALINENFEFALACLRSVTSKRNILGF
jgi:FkbM family methyltransferase